MFQPQCPFWAPAGFERTGANKAIRGSTLTGKLEEYY